MTEEKKLIEKCLLARESIEDQACDIQELVGFHVSKKQFPDLKQIQYSVTKIQNQLNTLYVMDGKLAMLERMEEEK